MSSNEFEPVSRQEKLAALRDVARYKPRFTIGIIGLGIVAAILEGVGLSVRVYPQNDFATLS